MPIRIPPPDDVPSSASPLVIAESDSHVTVAFEISRAELARHVRFLASLLRAARSPDGGADGR
jgi:hypothetical protein